MKLKTNFDTCYMSFNWWKMLFGKLYVILCFIFNLYKMNCMKGLIIVNKCILRVLWVFMKSVECKNSLNKIEIWGI